MKIKAITWQHRRDFTATYECQFCGHTKSGSGYDDSYFHNSVIPDMKCEKCGKSTNSEPDAEKPMVMTTRYPDMNLREKAKKACRLGKKGIYIGDSNNTDAYDKIYDPDDDEFDEEEQNMEDAYYRDLIGY